MSERWEEYITLVDDQPSAMLVDVGIAETSPDQERPVLLTMRLYMKNPTEDGFASEEEEPRLTEIEDAFIDAVELTTSAVLVGRIMTSGWLELYFYSKTVDGFTDTIDEAMEKYDDYSYEIDEAEDPEWANYFELLYPNESDFQQINNRHVIEHLVEEGDTLTAERTVDHFAAFRTAEERQEFITAVSEYGFRVADEDVDDDSENEHPYEVNLQRDHIVDWETIETVTFELFDAAQKFNGEYAGWKSPVVSE